MLDFFLAVGDNSLIIRSSDGKAWTQVNRDAAVDPIALLNITTDGNGTWLCSGQESGNVHAGRMVRSVDDAVTWVGELIAPWTADASHGGPGLPVTVDRYGVPDNNDKNGLGAVWDGTAFQTYLVADNTFHLSAPDGATWTKVVLPDATVTTGFFSFLYSSVTHKYFGLFNGVGLPNSYLASSVDMETWTTIATIPGALSNPYLVQSGSTILAFTGGSIDGNNSDMLVSHDGGATWTDYPNNIVLNDSGSKCVLLDTVSGNWVILAFNFFTGISQGVYTSTLSDGAVWTARQVDLTGTAPILRGVCRVATTLAVTGDSGVFFTSADNGTTWVEVGTQWESPAGLINNEWLFHFGDSYITYQSNGTSYMASSLNGLSTNWTSQYTPLDPILQMIGPSAAVIPPLGADEMLGLQLGVGFHRIATLPGTGRLRSIKEVQDPVSGKLIVLASDTNGQIWQLINQYTSGAIVLTAPVIKTQQLPTPDRVGVELRDTQKVFRSLWVEGTNLGDYVLDWSVDGGNTFRPAAPQTLQKGLNRIGATGTLIILRLTRTNTTPRYSLLSYFKLNWDVQGRSAN